MYARTRSSRKRRRFWKKLGTIGLKKVRYRERESERAKNTKKHTIASPRMAEKIGI